jgi:hypothetical protein
MTRKGRPDLADAQVSEPVSIRRWPAFIRNDQQTLAQFRFKKMSR